MSSQHGRRSTLPSNADLAASLRAGTTIDDLAARHGVNRSSIVRRLNDAGWGGDGHPNHRIIPDLFAGLADWPSWMDSALCAQTDGDVFFPERRDARSARAAKAVCAECPVRARCLQWALEHDERYGIWAGTTEVERRRMKRAAS